MFNIMKYKDVLKAVIMYIFVYILYLFIFVGKEYDSSYLYKDIYLMAMTFICISMICDVNIQNTIYRYQKINIYLIYLIKELIIKLFIFCICLFLLHSLIPMIFNYSINLYLLIQSCCHLFFILLIIKLISLSFLFKSYYGVIDYIVLFLFYLIYFLLILNNFSLLSTVNLFLPLISQLSIFSLQTISLYVFYGLIIYLLFYLNIRKVEI